MADTFTVQEVADEQREWQGQYGPMLDYSVKVTGSEGTFDVTLTQKPDTPAPSVGQELYGFIDNSSKFGPKFKKQQRDGNPSQARSNGSTAESADDPARRSIERQVAAKIAADLIGREGYTALSDERFGPEFLRVTNVVFSAIRGRDGDIPF